jgi:outer membrane protein assembly factor BamB
MRIVKEDEASAPWDRARAVWRRGRKPTYGEDSVWSRKGGTLSDKSARKECELTQQQIVRAIKQGKLQFRENYVFGNPYRRLLRNEPRRVMQIRSFITVITWVGIGVVTCRALADAGQEEESVNWPQFRGPDGDGVAHLNVQPTQWAEDRSIDWKVDLEGVAWSQPIVWGDQVLVTTAVAENQTKPRVGESGPGFSLFSLEGVSRALSGGEPPDTTYQWKLICLDLATGLRRWEKVVREAKPTIPIHRSNSYASETPVTDGRHIYVHIAMAGIYCFDMDGREIWNKVLDVGPMQYGWGTGSSPLLDKDTLYVLCDNEKESYLLAIDKTDGLQRWRVKREELSNWSTPYHWRNRVRSELVTCGGKKTQSYDPATGQVLWELRASGRCATSAVGDRELLYVGSVTRSTGSSGTLTAIRAGASGDLSRDDTDDAESFVAWSVPRAAPQLSSPLLYQGHLYTLRQQGGIIRCLDAASGKQLYRTRLPGAGGFTSSPWAAGGHVFCLDENGNTFVIAAGPELKVAGTNKLNGMFWSSAAMTNGTLLLRSADHLYRISPKD